jgi:hypothetical protein
MTQPVDRNAPPPAVAPVRAADGAGGASRADSPAFRALLESLERLAPRKETPPAVDDPDSLQRAIHDADDGFRQAMDLRRRLEEAFRQRLP